ncbi:hypothetical protein DFH09DRAFT_1067241 [Mycena vulgaris]|nr:hypothetical protein DFH09DRAFT_1067241 [Mycena vulgaris]
MHMGEAAVTRNTINPLNLKPFLPPRNPLHHGSPHQPDSPSRRVTLSITALPSAQPSLPPRHPPPTRRRPSIAPGLPLGAVPVKSRCPPPHLPRWRTPIRKCQTVETPKATMVPAGTATREMDGLRVGRIDLDPGFPLDTGRPAVLNVVLASLACAVLEGRPSSSTPRYAVVTKLSKTSGHGGGRTSTRGVSCFTFFRTGFGLVEGCSWLCLSSSSSIAARRNLTRPLDSQAFAADADKAP